MKLQEIAKEMLTNKRIARDPVRLANGESPEGLDLRGLVELEVKPTGTRVRMIDRGTLVLELLRQRVFQPDDDVAARFFGGLEHVASPNGDNIASLNGDIDGTEW